MDKQDRTVVFIHSDAHARALSRLPVHSEREAMTLSLLRGLSMAREQSGCFRMQFVAPTPATPQQLEQFHSKAYVDALQRSQDSIEEEKDERKKDAKNDDEEEEEEDNGCIRRPLKRQRQLQARKAAAEREQQAFDLVDDAYVFPGLFEYCRFVAGGTLTAVDALRHLASKSAQALAPVAIHLGGGRHHAMRDRASGFCYVNDVALGIQRLLRRRATDAAPAFERVLCVDLDVHHGDGVQEAFYFSAAATTLSFHLLERAFFPGTGCADEIGIGRGKFHNVNVPLRRGITDAQFVALVDRVVSVAIDSVAPDVLVLVCGVDTLARYDVVDCFNWCGVITN
ncbi:hypothetical protein PINS_up009140 [Pythium insidiosum]|nr:hypothetical protein PINS_up009140 [Pythium insidiosum]